MPLLVHDLPHLTLPFNKGHICLSFASWVGFSKSIAQAVKAMLFCKLDASVSECTNKDQNIYQNSLF